MLCPAHAAAHRFTEVALPGVARRRHLRETYGFDCRCERCRSPRGSTPAADGSSSEALSETDGALAGETTPAAGRRRGAAGTQHGWR